MSFKFKKIAKTLRNDGWAREIAMMTVSAVVVPLGEMLLRKMISRCERTDISDISDISDIPDYSEEELKTGSV